MRGQSPFTNDRLQRQKSEKAGALLFILSIMLLASATVSTNSSNHITGTVNGISKDSLTLLIANDDVRTVRISLMASTKFLKDGETVSFNDLSLGSHVSVEMKITTKKVEAVAVIIEKQPPYRIYRPTVHVSPPFAAA